MQEFFIFAENVPNFGHRNKYNKNVEKRLDKLVSTIYNKIKGTNKCSSEVITMTFSMILATVFETALVLFTIWAVFHENLFIALEDKICAYFRRRSLKVIKGSKTARTTNPSSVEYY